MFIRIEETPNPETLKFIPENKLNVDKSIFIKKQEAQDHGDFVNILFGIDGVKSILLDSGFISITKEKEDSWEILRTIITSKITTFLQKEGNIDKIEKEKKESVQLNPTEEKICDLLETKVKPVVATHGGEISFHSFKEGTVFLELKGSCAGCPSSTATLKMGIENMLKHFIEEVDEVVDINS